MGVFSGDHPARAGIGLPDRERIPQQDLHAEDQPKIKLSNSRLEVWRRLDLAVARSKLERERDSATLFAETANNGRLNLVESNYCGKSRLSYIHFLILH